MPLDKEGMEMAGNPDMEHVCDIADQLENELCGEYKELGLSFGTELAYLIEDYANQIFALDELLDPHDAA